MGFNYNPKDAVSLIPDGEYDAEIALAEDTKSKAGADMIKLTLKVWANGQRTVFDYVVNPSSLWRLKQIAAAIGQSDRFEKGDLGSEDISGRSLRVAIKTRKDEKGGFPDQNVVARYLPAAVANTAPANEREPGGDDDLNF